VNLDEAMNAAAEKLAAPETEPVIEAAPVVDAAPETPPAPTSEAPKPAAADRARDDVGRFAKAGEKPAAQKPPAAPKGDVHGAASAVPPPGPGKVEGAVSPAALSTEPVKPDAAPLKLPSSWKPAAREALAKAPREVQEEAVRIDREVRQVMQEAAPLKQRVAEVDRALAPFEGIARASGMDVMAYAGSVMQTAAMLFQGPVGNRPALIAQLIRQAGVNPEDVGRHLAGEAPAEAHQPAFDPRAEVQRVLQEERQREDSERARRSAQEFLATEPEFINDVYVDMAAIIESDKRAGRNPDVKRAYDRACRMNEDVAKILDQRKAAEAAKTATAATQASRAAAVSIRSSSPAPHIEAKGKGIDAAMDKARAKLGM
jgi:hypothetical protein